MASILVVDDNEQLRTMVRRMLAARGHAVTTAADGRQAIRQLVAGPVPDLVLTDLVMPEQEGIETIAHQTLSKPFSAEELDLAIAAALADE